MESRRVELLLCLGHIIIGTVTGLASDLLYPLELDESMKQEFVDTHNHFRRLVSNPEAANMRLMTWDDELAKLARNHVRKCSFAHSSPEELKTVQFPAVGENVYAGNEFYFDELMSTIGVTKQWFDEVEHFDYTDLSCAAGEICGHYTQLVWADSYKVGCAIARCSKIEGGFSPDLVTCAYGPGGNRYYDGNPLSPYVSGEACSACGDGDLCIDQLCNNTDRDIPFSATTKAPTTTISTTTAPEITTAHSTIKSSTPAASEVTTVQPTTASSTTTTPEVTTKQPTTASSATTTPEVTTKQPTMSASLTTTTPEVTTAQSTTESSTTTTPEVTTAHSTTAASLATPALEVKTTQPTTTISTTTALEVTTAHLTTTSSTATVPPKVTTSHSTTASSTTSSSTTVPKVTAKRTTTPYSTTEKKPTVIPTTKSVAIFPWLSKGKKSAVIWGSAATVALLLLYAWSKHGV